MQLNILGEPLEACCFEPITGWMRDGFCGTYEGDAGMHLLRSIMSFYAIAKPMVMI